MAIRFFLFLVVLSVSITIQFGSCTSISTSQSKVSVGKVHKIAVMNFDINNADWGGEFSDSMVHYLLKHSQWEIIERELIVKILEEQKLAKSGILDDSQSVQIGKILGVDAIIVGRGTALDLVESKSEDNPVRVDRGRRLYNNLVDTFSLKVILVQTGSIYLQSRKKPGTDWTLSRISKFILGFGVIWDREDLLVESSKYDEVARRMAVSIASQGR